MFTSYMFPKGVREKPRPVPAALTTVFCLQLFSQTVNEQICNTHTIDSISSTAHSHRQHCMSHRFISQTLLSNKHTSVGSRARGFGLEKQGLEKLCFQKQGLEKLCFQKQGLEKPCFQKKVWKSLVLKEPWMMSTSTPPTSGGGRATTAR